jgi:hypothetical protein
MHWLKMIFSWKYREATKTANSANQLVVDMMISSKSIKKAAISR